MRKALQKFISLVFAISLTIAPLQPAMASGGESLRAMDTSAGKPALIMVKGEPGEVVELTITNPYKSVVTQPFQLNASGVLQHWYDKAVRVGDYQVEYKGLVDTFTVSAGEANRKKSQLELSDYTAYVGESITGLVQLKDYYANLIKGQEVSLSVKGKSKVNCANGCKSNSQGMIAFAITSQQAGIKRVTIELNGKVLNKFDVGFIPYVQRPLQDTYSSSNSRLNNDLSSYDADLFSLLDPTRATSNAVGNDDALLLAQAGNDFELPGFDEEFSDDEESDALSESETLLSQNDAVIAESNASVQQPDGPRFEILFENDPDADFEEEVTVSAQSALDLMIRAVDEDGEVMTDYTGEIEFELDPEGPLLPSDYTFSALDQGVAVFELALVLPQGEYTFRVQDKSDPDMYGEVAATASFDSLPTLNNTEITLTIDSPIANSTYAGALNVQGATSTDNTEITVSEGSVTLGEVEVDESQRFNIPVDLDDGQHTLDITAEYLVDGSTTTTTINLKVDKTAPIIVEVTSDQDEVRAGEEFTMTATIDAAKEENPEQVSVQAFINNRVYDFDGDGETYTLTAKAPLDPGTYPINIRATDEFNNSVDSQEVKSLTVTAGLEEISNLFGIPGVESITLSWADVEGADSYEVSYSTVLGGSEESKTVSESRLTLEDLAPNVSYIFTVLAKDAAGNEVSLPTESRAIKVLAPPTPVAEVVSEPPPAIEASLHGAAVQPTQHTESGPEVYLLIFASIILLNIYGRVRRALARG